MVIVALGLEEELALKIVVLQRFRAVGKMLKTLSPEVHVISQDLQKIGL